MSTQELPVSHATIDLTALARTFELPTTGSLDALRSWLGRVEEPFPGARAVVSADDVEVVTTGRLGSPNSSFDVYAAVRQLAAEAPAPGTARPLVVLLEGPLTTTERALEDRLWHTLQHLSDFDDGPWDETVVRTLDGADHAFAVGGEPWSVELLHPQSPRPAHRSPWPVLVVRPLATR